MVERTSNGRAFRILNIIDEFSRDCLSIKVNRKISSQDVIDELFNLFLFRGFRHIYGRKMVLNLPLKGAEMA